MSNVVNLSAVQDDTPPCADHHEIAEWLRKLADEFDSGTLTEMTHIALIAIRLDSGLPSVLRRSVGRFMNALEWAGVLDWLQHQNYDGSDDE